MNRAELVGILRREGFLPISYNVADENKTEAYTLKHDLSGIVGRPSKWSVFYSERGLRTGERIFPTETLACEYFLEWIRQDPSTKGR